MTEQSQLGPSEDGTVVLDIGDDIGALIIMTPASMVGAEIEISPADDRAEDVFQSETAPPTREHTHDDEHSHTHGDGHTHDHADPSRTHVAVRERRGPVGIRYAAIYPGLREGSYTVWGLDGQPADTVMITGGQVSELDWT